MKNFQKRMSDLKTMLHDCFRNDCKSLGITCKAETTPNRFRIFQDRTLSKILIPQNLSTVFFPCMESNDKIDKILEKLRRCN